MEYEQMPVSPSSTDGKLCCSSIDGWELHQALKRSSPSFKYGAILVGDCFWVHTNHHSSPFEMLAPVEKKNENKKT